MARLPSLDRLRAKELEDLPAGHHRDGLFLRVDGGARRWVQRLTIRGRRVWCGLGPYPPVSLEMARDRAIDLRRGARDGKDIASQAVFSLKVAWRRLASLTSIPVTRGSGSRIAYATACEVPQPATRIFPPYPLSLRRPQQKSARRRSGFR